MNTFLLTGLIALVVSSVGFWKYVYFISIGYGFSVAAIGAGLLLAEGARLTPGTACGCVLFIVYGCRLGGYLAFREWKSAAYRDKMKTEIKSGKGMSLAAKCAIWVSAALLYALQTSPLTFRLTNGSGGDPVFALGLLVSAAGLAAETCADLQKDRAKRIVPGRFVDTGLYRLVRCPNYLGELLFWTGVFVGGLPVYRGAAQWSAALLGYAGIVFVMFSGARRLEIRQNKCYGNDPNYRRYASTTPIMIPFVPLYSVEKYRWLVA